MIRYALIRNARSLNEARAYLPSNYRVLAELAEMDSGSLPHVIDGRAYAATAETFARRVVPVFVIAGEDAAGWTLDDYVIPRYASGMIHAKEIDLSHPVMKLVPADAGQHCPRCGCSYEDDNATEHECPPGFLEALVGPTRPGRVCTHDHVEQVSMIGTTTYWVRNPDGEMVPEDLTCDDPDETTTTWECRDCGRELRLRDDGVLDFRELEEADENVVGR